MVSPCRCFPKLCRRNSYSYIQAFKVGDYIIVGTNEGTVKSIEILHKACYY
ncbi:MAG: mechanosensitive ion channel domain-containing protein [Lachnospira pectinoschiza]